MITHLPCVLFAGGKSSRMGEDKALLPFGNFDTLAEYQLSRLNKIFKTVYVSCKEKSKFKFEARFIEDISTTSAYAPTIGFISVFKTLQCEEFFAISVDTPFISDDIIKALILKNSCNVEATIAKTSSGMQPMCGIYHNSLKDKFEKMLLEGNHKLGFLLKNSNIEYLNFDDEEAFLNLNHPHEYQKALELLKI
ncbi:MAG: molybdenum cofactor guanylyltransferase [Campylobacterota bacterium]|nr:molybdenum cofactor guanylyltransferase [Campylobacterota bacterium]